ncbi:MAG TPA: FAD-binding and (Fe-S)-binding domain-containing protein [Thermoanaerobaculia bacterium]|nr:FAD-binding and (Fe-S)-binding domain-containing protein [Thermoanaerobaculia bacterium]
MTPKVDSAGLASALRKAVRGEVRFDAGSRALYASDSSNYRQVPIGVVVPRDRDDVLEALAVCRSFGAPILGRGAGTSLAGQCCNVAVVLDTSKYFNHILEIDPDAKTARVEPGVVLDDLRDAAERHGLTFGPDPATHAYCTLGGMIGNNSCGVHSVMAGKTDDNVLELDVVAGDGTRLTVGPTSDEELRSILAGGRRRAEIYAKLRALADRYAPLIRSRYPEIPRRVSGYNLPYLLPENGFDLARALVGSEGTCAFLLEAKVRLVWSPPARVLVVLGYSDVYAAADAVPEILEHRPIGLEGFDDGLISDMEKIGLFPENLRLLPEGRGWLLVEMGAAAPAEALASAERLVASVGSRGGAVSARIFDRREEAARVWQVRQAALGATAHPPGSPLTWEGWEDAAVAPERLASYLRGLRALLDRYGYGGDLYGHFGQGCVHTRTDFDLVTAEGIAKFRAFLYEAADLVIAHGGSISGEHGDGQSRAELLPKMFGPELVQAFREFKAIWDPDGLMNPGKLVDPYRADENLRHTARRLHALSDPAFAYAKDAGDFPRALQRCVGVGECRRAKGGVMCPSFRVTREEKHTTRGRARLLDEMMRGEVLEGGWREDAVREALDLCLACKGCKSDCPVGVDVAAWKAEFLHRYYRGRLRPAAAYSLGLVHRWARVASAAPAVANLVTRSPGLATIAKALGGIAPERSLPRFASETFRRWFERRRRRTRAGESQRGRPVLLFPDTFTNFFSPGIGRAAVDVLEGAGFDVEMPEGRACCGRPLFDWGMLDAARRLLANVLDSVSPAIARGIPVVVLEPSCAAVFKDELPELFPGDERAARLAACTRLLADLLETEAPDWSPPTLPRRALVQFHCHQRAVFGVEADRRLLSRLAVETGVPDSGCCGMAGAFGFEKSRYEVSMAIGEQVLLPEVRKAAPETLLVADGFSCREQIAQGTGRRALHLAEVIRRAMEGSRQS